MIQESIEGFPLSPQQERLWTVGARGGGATPGVVLVVVGVDGEVDPPALRAALEAAAARHDALRTRLFPVPGLSLPVQVVGTVPAIGWYVLETEPGGEPSFDLVEGPVLRAVLIRTSSRRHRLLLSAPACLADAASLILLVRDLARCLGGGPSISASEVPLQYPAVAIWLNELLDSEGAREGQAFWRRQLRHEQPPSALPFAEPGAAGKLRLGAWESRLDCGRLAVLEQAAASLGVSPGAFCLAAWEVVLARATGEREIMVGVGLDGRTDEELAGTVGPLARVVPLTVRAAPERRFRELAAETAAGLAATAEWQECFRWDDLARSRPWIGRVGFLPHSFEFLALPEPESAGGLVFRVEDISAGADLFQVRLTCLRETDGLLLRLDHDDAALPAAYVRRLGAQLEAALGAAMAAPDREIGDLDLVGESERRELVRGRAVDGSPAGGSGLPALLAEQARRTPGHVAVEAEGRLLTYSELDAEANRLARRLVRVGVGADVLVALFLERSPEMVIAILATLKAGGAYVPVDPAHPAERIRSVLEDARPAVLLTRESLAGLLPAGPLRVVVLDRETDAIAAESSEPLAWPAAPDNLAYVLYTSGSTGRAKGVMVNHRGLENQIAWICREFSLGDDDVLLQRTAFTFDASVWELLAPLASGARLLLVPPGEHQDPAVLARLCREHGVTLLQVVPSLLRVLVDQPDLAACTPLRRVLCGGEALTPELLARCRERLRARLVNLYGPTETTIQVLFWEDDGEPERRVVPLGQEVPNTRSHVLDARMRLCPVGVPGEIHIGGVGLARGYLGRPDLTAERFVPDPLGGPGERLYRTGDLARLLPDGGIEFLGRVDHQVKLRGFRIELGEIEAVLDRHPGLRQAVAVVRQDGGSPHLVAYVLPRSSAPGIQELRLWLQRFLPEPMIPSAFVILERLPVLPNGKVDRRMLPAPEALTPKGLPDAPRTATQEIVAQVWAEVLGLDWVRLEESFFDLGGHSLLATQVTSRLERLFGVALSLRAFFETPTVSRLASRIDAQRLERDLLAPPPLVPGRRPEQPPLSFAQEALWSIAQLDPGSTAYNVHLALRLTGRLRRAALVGALGELVRRHEILRTVLPAERGRSYQRVLPCERLELPRLDLRQVPAVAREAELARVHNEEAHRPFDLAVGPLFRPLLVELREQEHALLLGLHHAVTDGWSLGVLVREASALYRVFAEGQPSPLPELPLQYADFAVWQRSWVTGDVLDSHLAFWKDHLEELPPALELPYCRARPVGRRSRGERVAFEFEPGLSTRLRQLCRSEEVTLSMLFLAAFQALLWHDSGQTDFVLGVPIAARSRLETEGLIGLFVNMLPLRARLSGDLSFRGLLGRVRETLIGASAHQELPFERLLEELRPERIPGQSPIYQIVFTMQNAPMPALELPDLTLSPVPYDKATAKYDLLWEVWQTPHRLAGGVTYSVELFNASTVRRMWDRYAALLAAAAAAPEEPLSSLAVFTAEEEALFVRDVGIDELRSEFLL